MSVATARSSQRAPERGRAAPSDGSEPRSILRTLHVLSRLAAAPQGLSLSQMSQALALPKTSLHTMLRVLERARFVSASDGRFRIGPAAVRLGTAIAGAPRAFPDSALGVLEDVARRTGETALLAVLTPDRRSCRYVASVETENWLRFSVPVDSLKPAYATGSGQAMLAWLDDGALREALAGVRFDRITASTVSSRAALMHALRRVRERGVSTVEGGTVSGVVAVAAPVMGADGACVGAVTVGGPQARVAPRIDDIEREVAEAAQLASALLGYLGAWPPARAPSLATHPRRRPRS